MSMAKKTKDSKLSVEERLEQALIPNWDEPYRLPENWCWIHWGNCGQFIAGGAFKEKYQGFLGLPIPFYKVGSLKYSDNNGYLYDETNTIDEEIRNQLKVSLIPVNSIIFAKIGEAIRLNRRSLNSNPCCIDNNLMAFVTNDKCYYKYAYYWSKSIDLYEYANATTVPAIRKSDLESIPFPLAPYGTQVKIVNYIESLFAQLDEAKEKAQEVVDGFETRKAAILHKAFSGELTVKWRKQHNIADDSWTIQTLGEVCHSIFDGDHMPPPKSESGIPFLVISNVNTGYLSFEDTRFVPKEYYDEITATRKPQKGDVLYTIVGSYGIPVVVDTNDPFCFQRHMALLKPKTIDTYFLWYLLQTQDMYQKATAIAKGVAQLTVPIKGLRQMSFMCPTNEEQKEIVRLLDVFIKKENQVNQAAETVIEQIDTMKKAILARAFRGELGTNDPSEESAVELLKQVLNTVSEPKKSIKRTTIPKALNNRIKTDLERKIIKLYFQNEVDVLSIDLIMGVSSKKFEIMEALRNLQQRGLLEKQNDKYKLLG